MDNDKSGTGETERDLPKASLSAVDPLRGTEATDGKAKSGLPVAEPFQAFANVAPSDRTGVFGHLVTDDTDIAGLVAYSIYKQNKLDWLTAFETEKGRAPNTDELSSYIIGEGTPRRIATYRHLAEATLAGNGPAVGSAASPTPRVSYRRPRALADTASLTSGTIVTYALVAVVFLVGFLLAAHYTMSSR